ncbi:DUF3310 domain-containing protein [Lacticaseibacillus songhuajiangensis]|jgi:hypothetical protein|uniref:DUF3310 domain-containing protein n=1 Tax=Lacticaseibacillus songhuajiangensis TaxID=1296539 RepID=UPI000F78BC33|nr:DUF3310 domain-containing protein [Lacticaseibacillus songhuajiangensis]
MNNETKRDVMSKGTPSLITKPSYYKGAKFDVIDFLYDQYGADADIFMVGNIVKYVSRYQGKNGIEDLVKAGEYLRRLQVQVEGRQVAGDKLSGVLRKPAKS